MATRKPIIIDGEKVFVEADAKIADVVNPETQDIVTCDGKVIPRSVFRNTPVPDGMTQNLVRIEKGHSKKELLRSQSEKINDFLNEFESPPYPGGFRSVSLEANDQFMVVKNFPLPDGYRPDYVDLLIDLTNHPDRPPIGLYLLINNNRQIIERIQNIFGNHIFQNGAHYGAQAIDGFAWICLHYKDHQWRFNAKNVNKGDNLRKFLEIFYAKL